MKNAQIAAMLQEKEARWHHVIRLANEWEKPVIIGSVVMPGLNKNNRCAEVVFRELVRALDQPAGLWPPLHREVLRGVSGPALILVLAQDDAHQLKRALVKIEESNPAGRLFDLDVYDKGGRPIGRAELGLPDRRCLVCGGQVSECRRAARHTVAEVMQRVEEILKMLPN